MLIVTLEKLYLRGLSYIYCILSVSIVVLLKLCQNPIVL